MALTGTGDSLGTRMMNELNAAVSALSAADKQNPDILQATILKAFGRAIIDHFIANGSSAVLVSGVQSGSSSAPGNLV